MNALVGLKRPTSRQHLRKLFACAFGRNLADLQELLREVVTRAITLIKAHISSCLFSCYLGCWSERICYGQDRDGSKELM